MTDISIHDLVSQLPKEDIKEQIIAHYNFVKYVITVVAVLLIVAIASVATMVWAVFRRAERGGARTFSLLAQHSGILQLTTVVVIVMAVFVLRLIDKVTDEGVVGIMSGIAGFVLGHLSGSQRSMSRAAHRIITRRDTAKPR